VDNNRSLQARVEKDRNGGEYSRSVINASKKRILQQAA